MHVKESHGQSVRPFVPQRMIRPVRNFLNGVEIDPVEEIAAGSRRRLVRARRPGLGERDEAIEIEWLRFAETQLAGSRERYRNPSRYRQSPRNARSEKMSAGYHQWLAFALESTRSYRPNAVTRRSGNGEELTPAQDRGSDMRRKTPVEGCHAINRDF
jgi:hypothetical protein